MGEQFSDYLGWTVWRCVCMTTDATGRNAALEGRWDLYRDGWPPLPNSGELQVARAWALGEFKRLANACGLDVDANADTFRIHGVNQRAGTPTTPDSLGNLLHAPFIPPFLRDPQTRDGSLTDGSGLKQLHRLLGGSGTLTGGLLRPGVSPTAEDTIAERAIRSLYDWRATLRFLSELRLLPDRGLTLVEPNPSVVDAFNVHITRNRRPNLVHSMLAHLREPARMRVLLTTNFDTLIEDAFAQRNRRLDVISVSIHGQLPDAETVHARDTLVKLHGTLTETRADFSLDTLPSLEDRRRFFHYVRGGPPKDGTEGHAASKSFVPGDLLVAGYSGSDARCVQMMKFVLDNDRAAKVFWVCHSERDFDRLSERFSERGYEKRVIVTVSERFDLLLYELHQRLCLSLPPGGSTYPGSYHVKHNAPPEKAFRSDERPGRQPLAAGASQIIDHFSWLGGSDANAAASKGDRARLAVIDGSAGVSRILADASRELTRRHGLQSVWLELEDFGDTASVAHELFQTIALRRGIFQLRHAQLCPSAPPRVGAYRLDDSPQDRRQAKECGASRLIEWGRHLDRLCVHLGLEAHRCLVSIYGRNGPGHCTGWHENKSHWGADEYGDHSRFGEFTIFLAALAKAGFNILYAPYTSRRRSQDRVHMDALRSALQGWSGLGDRRISIDAIDAVLEPHKSDEWLCHDFGELEGARVSRSNSSRSKPRSGDAVEPNNWGTLAGAFADLECRPLCYPIVLPREQPAARPQPSEYRSIVNDLLLKVFHLNHTSTTPYGRETTSATDADRDKIEVAALRGRYNLIYGASLFRQSRHYTAFLIEGLLRCPVRFNAEGVDNDLVRQQRLDEKLDAFNRSPLLFSRKPGGFAWTYRDIHTAMRCMAELTSQKVFEADQQSKRTLRLLPCEDLRARTHFWIGHWYARAFYVSNNAIPVLEAAFHFFQCAVHAQRANTPWLQGESNDDPLRRYRLHWWYLGLNQLTRTLRFGGRSIRFWLGRQPSRWFDEASSVLGALRQANRRIVGDCPADTSSRPLLESPHEALVVLLAAELEQLERWMTGTGPWLQNHNSLHGTSSGPQEDGDHEFRVVEPDLDSIDPKWWESFAPSTVVRRILEETETYVTNGDEQPEREMITKIELGLSRRGGEPESTGFSVGPREAAELLQTLVEWTFLVLSRAKREECAEPPVSLNVEGPGSRELRTLFVPMSIRRQWVRVCMLAQASEDAWHWLPAGPDSFGAAQASKAMAMYGLALARLGRFHEAHRRFAQAHALLSEVGSNPIVDLGILELRRAEAYLLEANLAKELADVMASYQEGDFDASAHNGELFEALSRPIDTDDISDAVAPKLITDSLNAVLRGSIKNDGEVRYLGPRRRGALWRWLHSKLGSEQVENWKQFNEALRRLSTAWCDDAWGCLERAESMLGGHTHSPLWWSRLRALQLQAFATCSHDRTNSHLSTYRALTHRVRHDAQQTVVDLWREGVAAEPDGDYNCIRMLDHCWRALATVTTGCRDELPAFSELRDAAQSLKDEPRPAGLSQRYLQLVMVRLEEDWKRRTAPTRPSSFS
jgi:hypothetical protein